METTTATAETAIAASAQPQPYGPAVKCTGEQVVQLVAALEEPFDPREIKWRVTNTTSDRRRGQVIAYADPRAYTDRLNALFTVRGWTREYSIQVIQNFERMERGNSGARISGKIVVACKLTIEGFGAHSGLGKSGLTTKTPRRQRKRRRSSGHAPASALVDTCTTSPAVGWTWMKRSNLCPDRSCPSGHSRDGSRVGTKWEAGQTRTASRR